MTKEEIIEVIHKTIYQFFDTCGDNEETPLSDKDKLLLSVNKAICNNIKTLPPATPTQRWIPVSERLPEIEGDYLLWGKVCEDEEEYRFIGSYDSGCEQFGIWEEQFDRTTLGCLGGKFFEYASVSAWMPLPKPYREDKGE